MAENKVRDAYLGSGVALLEHQLAQSRREQADILRCAVESIAHH